MGIFRLVSGLVVLACVSLLSACVPFSREQVPLQHSPVVMGYISYGIMSVFPEKERYAHIEETGFRSVLDYPQSTFSVDVDTAAYANIRRMIDNGALPPPDAVRIEEMINYFPYDYPGPVGGVPFSVTTESTICPWNSEHRLVSIGLRGRAVDKTDLPAANLVFLIDVSGSMREELPLLRVALRTLVGELRSQDRVAIVVYAGSAGLVLPSTAGNERSNILAVLDSLEAGGSTAGGAGIDLAYATAEEYFIPNGNNRVVLATDGDFNVGPSTTAELHRLIERRRDKGIALSVLGFGHGNLNDEAMETLADKGNGNYSYIDRTAEARKVLREQFAGTLLTIAKDVKIQVEFNPAQVASYRLVGYENRRLRDEDFVDDQKDAGDIGAGHTVTALYEIEPSVGKSMGRNLRYVQASIKPAFMASDELFTVRLRYKNPGGDQSRLVEQSVVDHGVPIEQSSTDLRFASAVAELGLLLRDSQYKNQADYGALIRRAKGARGEDRHGYRAGFLQLAKDAQVLAAGLVP